MVASVLGKLHRLYTLFPNRKPVPGSRRNMQWSNNFFTCKNTGNKASHKFEKSRRNIQQQFFKEQERMRTSDKSGETNVPVHVFASKNRLSITHRNSLSSYTSSKANSHFATPLFSIGTRAGNRSLPTYVLAYQNHSFNSEKYRNGHHFSTGARRRDIEKPPSDPPQGPSLSEKLEMSAKPQQKVASVFGELVRDGSESLEKASAPVEASAATTTTPFNISEPLKRVGDPYYLHALCKKNNTVLTLCNQNNNPVIRATAGKVGFKGAQRGTFEAAHQVVMRLFDVIQRRHAIIKIGTLEIIFKEFGQGKDALFKCLMGPEGSWLKEKVIMITDKTPIKFGGCRGKKPRRL